MARLLDLPVYWSSREIVSGPRSVNAAATTSLSGYVQTVASPFGSWVMQFSFPPLANLGARRMSGLITALHGGANAVMVPMSDPDRITMAEAGVQGVSVNARSWSVPWSNTLPWSNGQNWQAGYPTVPMGLTASEGASRITIANSLWGWSLGIGDWVGIEPQHFAAYQITQTHGQGQYSIWPPLRKAINVGDRATLFPYMAMRLLSEGQFGRGRAYSPGAQLTMVEVHHADVVRLFSR